ncbi:MAG: hypothetical protein U5R31_06815 [Acidimicrobiia bacterium]|nr:hypothetical protein [Acidimicrobiia bacterium]
MKLRDQALGALVGTFLVVLLLLTLDGFARLLGIVILATAVWLVVHLRERRRALDEIVDMPHQSRERVETQAKRGNLWSKGWNLGGRSKDLHWKDWLRFFGNRHANRRPR